VATDIVTAAGIVCIAWAGFIYAHGRLVRRRVGEARDPAPLLPPEDPQPAVPMSIRVFSAPQDFQPSQMTDEDVDRYIAAMTRRAEDDRLGRAGQARHGEGE
jgi:hypothetical protein